MSKLKPAVTLCVIQHQGVPYHEIHFAINPQDYKAFLNIGCGASSVGDFQANDPLWAKDYWLAALGHRQLADLTGYTVHDQFIV